MIRLLPKSVKRILKSAASVGSGTAPAISLIPASLVQSSSWLKTTSGLIIYFAQNTKKANTDQWLGWDVFVKATVRGNLKIQWNHETRFIEGQEEKKGADLWIWQNKAKENEMSKSKVYLPLMILRFRFYPIWLSGNFDLLRWLKKLFPAKSCRFRCEPRGQDSQVNVSLPCLSSPTLQYLFIQ